jgi:hypothetical protein
VNGLQFAGHCCVERFRDLASGNSSVESPAGTAATLVQAPSEAQSAALEVARSTTSRKVSGIKIVRSLNATVPVKLTVGIDTSTTANAGPPGK